MRFTCPRCGKKYASADEPAPGRVYALTCRCGTKITVKGPEARPPGAPEPTPAPSAARGFDPFPSERRRTQGGAPVSNVGAGSAPVSPRPGEPTPSSSWGAGTQTQRVPLKEATPSPVSAAARPAPAAPRPAPAAPRAAPQPAAPLDPFADMPNLQMEARGEARPLTSVPDIRGPVPEPAAAPASYDPFAAQHGLLLDEEEARAIAGRAPVLEPRVEPGASEADESAVTFSDQIPVPAKRRVRAVLPRVASRGRGRLGLAVAALAVVGAGAAAAWFFLGQTRSSPPAQAVARPRPSAPAPPLGSPPIPAPTPPAVAPAPATSAPATPPPAAAVAPGPAPASPARAEPRPEPRREATRKAEPRRVERQERPVAAAPDPAPREPEKAEPPAPPPKPEEPPNKPAADKSVLDLMARKQDTGPSAAPAGGPPRGELTSAEVGAAIKASSKAFDSCVAEAAHNEPALQVVGRRVGLYITVNPSGLVTGPRLDDADLDDSVLGACLKATARKMVFPAFQGEAFQVRIPMVLGGGK